MQIPSLPTDNNRNNPDIFGAAIKGC